MTTRGLIVGRFQPPHLGHLELFRYALDQVDEIIIAIAAAQISHTQKNPLTAGERVEMMRSMLENQEFDPHSYWIIPTQDIMDNALWVAHLKRLLPKFDVFFGNNPFTELLFEEHGIECRSTPMFERDKYEASTIRQLLIDHQSVDEYLDPTVNELLRAINISRRFKGITTTDSASSSSKAGSELADMT